MQIAYLRILTVKMYALFNVFADRDFILDKDELKAYLNRSINTLIAHVLTIMQ